MGVRVAAVTIVRGISTACRGTSIETGLFRGRPRMPFTLDNSVVPVIFSDREGGRYGIV